MKYLRSALLLIGFCFMSFCHGITKTEFQRAVLNGETEVVKQALKKNAYELVKLRDKSHNTPLHLAATAKKGGDKSDIIALLLKYGADVNATNQHYSAPLHLAVATNNIKGAKVLLKEHSILVNTRSSANMTPLHYAVANRSKEMLTLLLSHPEINPNEGNSDTITPLHLAAQLGHLEEAKILLNDVRTNAEPVQFQGDFNGATPLHYAAMQAHPEVVELLLSHKQADVNALIKGGLYGGFSPVHCAAINPHTPRVFKVLKLLLEAGALFNLKTDTGKLPQDLTSVRVIIEFLKDPSPSYELKQKSFPKPNSVIKG